MDNDTQIAEFDNRAGIARFHTGESPDLMDMILMLAPGFSEDDMIYIKLQDLNFIGRQYHPNPGGGGYENFEYAFGPRGVNRLDIDLFDYIDIRMGSIRIHMPGLLTITRSHDASVEFNPPPNPPPEEEQGYQFYSFVNSILQAEAKRQDARRKGRNLAAFRQTMGNLRPAGNTATPANWYAGPPNPVPAMIAAPIGPGNIIASGLTGLRGTQKQQALQLRELGTRIPGAPGAGRRRKARKTRRRA